LLSRLADLLGVATPLEHRMHRTKPTSRHGLRATLAAAIAAMACATAPAQTPPDAVPVSPAVNALNITTLKQAYAAAWALQPEALALQARREAVRATQQAAQAWTPEPAALEVSGKTDRISGNQGTRELSVGVAVPIWLPGERRKSGALADAEAVALESRVNAAQLRVAASVRDAWWAWQRASIDTAAAQAQGASARRIAADVAKRRQAGDLARADQHQADGAVAAADSLLAQARAEAVAAQQQLRALTGSLVGVAQDAAPPAPNAEPEPSAAAGDGEAHAATLALKDRATAAQRAADLAAAQSRANPELSLAATTDRGAFGERYQRSLTLGVRIPFGGGARHGARVANALAESAEANAQWDAERLRVAADLGSARARVDATRRQVDAAQRRAQLAGESRGFFDKSFRLGETDLPTRLRIEAEASDAERQAARARIDLAAAISAWRQALGLLPL
jgi:outer membrane protein, heavy metal efflux system